MVEQLNAAEFRPTQASDCADDPEPLPPPQAVNNNALLTTNTLLNIDITLNMKRPYKTAFKF
jgi:hypothetical protein